MSVKTQRRGRLASMISVMALATGLVLSGAMGASAAPGHQNTDPYNTGCARSKSLVSSKNFGSWGTMSVWQSTACGTNWTEWYGSKQEVMKYISTVGGGHTDAQMDNATWSYSMQTYAPGTTQVMGTFVFDGNPVTFRCGTGCRWW